MAGPEGVDDEEHNAHVDDESTSAPPPPPDSDSAGEDEPLESSTPRSEPEEGQGDEHLDRDVAPPTDSDDTGGEEGLSAKIQHFVADLGHQIANVTSYVLEAAHLEKKPSPDGTDEEKQSPDVDSGEEKQAPESDDQKQGPDSDEPEFASRGGLDLSELKLQRNPKKSFSVTNDSDSS